MIVNETALELLIARATRATLLEVLTPLLQREHVEDLELASARQVAELLDCTPDHVSRLMDQGELGEVYDIRSPGSTRAVRRVARLAVATWLNQRRVAGVMPSASDGRRPDVLG